MTKQDFIDLKITKEAICRAEIEQQIKNNCSSLTIQNGSYFLSKKDVVNILCTSYWRLNKAFHNIQRSSNPMTIDKDFKDIEGIRYYSLSGFYQLSQHLAQVLTVKERRSWCGLIEFVGKKTFKRIIGTLAR
jgi:hypothetical protein